MKMQLIFPEMRANMWKNALRILQQYLDSDPDAYHFQNLISSFLSTDTSLVKCSRRSSQ